ncbi:MAG: hypothetical protein AAFU54_02175 [Chloroflexota bacterium]
MTRAEEKTITTGAAIALLVGIYFLIMLLILDLTNKGLVWRVLNSLRSPNNSTLPGEQRSIGDDTNQANLHFLA